MTQKEEAPKGASKSLGFDVVSPKTFVDRPDKLSEQMSDGQFTPAPDGTQIASTDSLVPDRLVPFAKGGDRVILPSLIGPLGLLESALLQQLHWRLGQSTTRINGRICTLANETSLKFDFPCVTTKTLRDVRDRLAERSLIRLTKRDDVVRDDRLWASLDTVNVARLIEDATDGRGVFLPEHNHLYRVSSTAFIQFPVSVLTALKLLDAIVLGLIHYQARQSRDGSAPMSTDHLFRSLEGSVARSTCGRSLKRLREYGIVAKRHQVVHSNVHEARYSIDYAHLKDFVTPRMSQFYQASQPTKSHFFQATGSTKSQFFQAEDPTMSQNFQAGSPSISRHEVPELPAINKRENKEIEREESPHSSFSSFEISSQAHELAALHHQLVAESLASGGHWVPPTEPSQSDLRAVQQMLDQGCPPSDLERVLRAARNHPYFSTWTDLNRLLTPNPFRELQSAAGAASTSDSPAEVELALAKIDAALASHSNKQAYEQLKADEPIVAEFMKLVTPTKLRNSTNHRPNDLLPIWKQAKKETSQ